MMYKVTQGLVPEYLSSLFTPLDRNTRGKTFKNFRLGPAGRNWGKRRLAFHGAELWNQLPPQVKAINKLGQFNGAIKKLARDGFKFYSP